MSMVFPSKLLHESEELVVEVRPHWIMLAKPSLALTVAAAIVATLLFFYPGVPIWVLGILAALLALPAAWWGIKWAKRQSMSLVITTYRVITRSGILSRQGWELPLGRINQVSYYQSLWGRLFGVGTLSIETGGETGVHTLGGLPHPDALQSLIYHQIDIKDMTMTPTTVVPETSVMPRASIADEIGKLDGLRRRGVITEEEFQRGKERLLGN